MSNGHLNGDDWVRVIGLLMALTLVLGGFWQRRARIPSGAWPMLVWMALTWAAIIAAAALGFRHFRPDGL